MTPGARVAAAIEILDEMADGAPAEKALTRWARRSRFAGSKDRAAIRDYVFDLERSRRTAAHYGRAETGRALMLGLLHQQGADLDALFDGNGHAPSPLTADEAAFPTPPSDKGVLWNMPDWILPEFEASLGDAAAATARISQDRAPVTLRVNLAKGDVAAAQDMLRGEGIETTTNPTAKAALTIQEGDRKLRNSQAFSEGYVELQDAASQAVVQGLPKGGTALDYCAGGGGKALALVMDGETRVFAHDAAPHRMKDLPHRAARAGANVTVLETDDIAARAPFDLVLCDAPCSGSGAWRRAPSGKWALTPDGLMALQATQDGILDQAATLVRAGGTLAYATCSVLRAENEARVEAFLDRHAEWRCSFQQRLDVTDLHDGFFVAHLTHA